MHPRRAVGRATGERPLSECAERLPEKDKLEAERIVKAYAEAAGYSVKVELQRILDPERPPPIVVLRNRFGAAVLAMEADTIGGAWALCCMRIAQREDAGSLAELLIKIDMLGAG